MLLQLFRSFYVQNYPADMEECIDAFAIFGGFGRALDLDIPLHELIVSEVLDHYDELNATIGTIVKGNGTHEKLLSAIARGDRRVHSAFRRSRVSEIRGHAMLDELRLQGILNVEFSREAPPQRDHPKQQLKREIARHRISHKMRFSMPFLRFWFYFIAPYHQQIIKGDYSSVIHTFEQQHLSFSGYAFEELCNLYLLLHSNDELLDLGSYWDRQVEIDILARTKKGHTIVGECKWTNHKINRKELHRLEEKCEKIGLEYDEMLLFSKRGFSNELTQTQNKALILYRAEDLKELLANVKNNEILKTPFN
jgi:uncharacterized protein